MKLIFAIASSDAQKIFTWIDRFWPRNDWSFPAQYLCLRKLLSDLESWEWCESVHKIEIALLPFADPMLWIAKPHVQCRVICISIPIKSLTCGVMFANGHKLKNAAPLALLPFHSEPERDVKFWAWCQSVFFGIRVRIVFSIKFGIECRSSRRCFCLA